jgi:beta-glucosidase-like glycosyl hydrolase
MEVRIGRCPRRRLRTSGGLLCLLLVACSSAPGGADRGGRTTTSRSPDTSATSSSASPSTSVPPVPASGAEAAVDAALQDLDLRARVAQLFLVGVPLDDLDGGAPLARSGIGGLFLAGRSEASAGDLAAVTAQWQADAPGPGLWIAADQEGGQVQSLKGPGFEPMPSALAQGRLPADRLAALADGLGKALDSAGVNLDLAPVVDVVPAGTERANAPIGAYEREYGSTAGAVTEAAATIVQGLADAGVTATLKHFPGLGRVERNTDSAAAVTDTVTTAGDDQVQAFGTLARSASAPFVMVSSATYARIDPRNQAMFSSVVLTDVLRGQLRFDGVIVSDDVGNAEAVQAVPPDERALRFLKAGGTMILTVRPDDVPAMIDEVVRGSRHDPGFARTVDAAVRTALLAKARAGLLPPG